MRLESLGLPLAAIVWAASCTLDASGIKGSAGGSTSAGSGGGATSSVNTGGGGTTSTAQGGAGAGGGTGGDGGTGGIPCVPAAEDCATLDDESCDGEGMCKGTLAWKVTFGSASFDEAQSVAVDSNGNSVVAGRFQSTITAAGINLTNQGGDDLFVVKLDPGGNPLWAFAYGDGAKQDQIRVAVDSNGNVLLTGRFEGAIAFEEIPLVQAGDGDIFVAKLDPAGASLWSKRFGSTGPDGGMGIAADSAGNILITGYFGGITAFEAISLSHAGGDDMFIAKLDPDGGVLWAKGAGDGAAQLGSAVAVNSDGEVAATGAFRGDIHFGGVTFTEQSANDAMFVVKLDASGNHQWSTAFGGAALLDQNGQALAFDPQGNLIIASDFEGTTVVSGETFVSNGLDDGLLIAFDDGGTYLWGRSFGSAQLDTPRGLAVDSLGQLAITGPAGGSFDLGDGPLPFGGDFDMFAAKLGPDPQAHRWSHAYGNNKFQLGTSVAFDKLGSAVVVGIFEGELDGSMSNGSAGDAFVMKFNP